MRVSFRPSIASDWTTLMNTALPCRIKAITAIGPDGEPIGIGGIGWRPDGKVVAFAQISEAGRKYPAAIHRAGVLAMRMIAQSGVTSVIAEAQENNPAAERWLLRLGFVPQGEAYVWEARH